MKLLTVIKRGRCYKIVSQKSVLSAYFVDKIIERL